MSVGFTIVLRPQVGRADRATGAKVLEVLAGVALLYLDSPSHFINGDNLGLTREPQVSSVPAS